MGLSFFCLQIQRGTGIIKNMKLSNTERYHFFPSSLAHFADRSARALLITPENVSALVELVSEQIAAFLDFSQLTALNRSFLSEALREQEADLVFRVPFRGWLLTVLQKESASVEEITRALETALQHLETLQASHTQQYHQAILYLASLVYHRRSPAERQTLIQVVDAYAPTMEVETMLQSMAEITYQQGIEQGIEQGTRQTSIESTLAILNTRFPDADLQTLTAALEAIDNINRLKELNIEASVVDTFYAFQERLQA